MQEESTQRKKLKRVILIVAAIVLFSACILFGYAFQKMNEYVSLNGKETLVNDFLLSIYCLGICLGLLLHSVIFAIIHEIKEWRKPK